MPHFRVSIIELSLTQKTYYCCRLVHGARQQLKMHSHLKAKDSKQRLHRSPWQHVAWVYAVALWGLTVLVFITVDKIQDAL